MNATPGTPGSTGSGVSRRVLLSAGGLVILAGCGVADPGRPDPAPEGTPAPSPGVARPARGSLAAGGPAPPAAHHPAASRLAPPGAHHPAASRPAPPATSQTRLSGYHGAAGPPHRPAAAGDDQPMYYLHDGAGVIALTIDDGPSPIYTPQILRLLHRYRITASFSMIGINVDAYPGVARDVAEAGHMIVNHTWTHLDLAFLSSVAVRDQMDYATDAIHRATGRIPQMFRAPYGAWSPTVLEWCEQTRMSPLDWSVDPRDWSRPGTGAIIRNIMRNTQSGSIILEHDGGGNRSQTVAALRVVLPRLLAAGFRFTTP
jgi:peptidoglycan-N-acetylglucosamine deacetylase